MFFKVMATFLKIVLFDLKRYCIWLEDALYVAGTVCATCFFLPEVLYLVRYEMGLWIKNAYLHVGKKHWLIEMKRYIFKRSGFLQRNATYWKGILFLLKECYTLWMKVSVCKACSCHLELVKRRMHVWSSLVVIYSVFTAFFRFGEKTQSWMIFFMWVESLLKGNFAERLRYLEVRKLYLRHSLEGVRTKRS